MFKRLAHHVVSGPVARRRVEGWSSAWQGREILIRHGDELVDRIDAEKIERVIFVHDGETLSAGALPFAVVVLPDACIVLPAVTGFAGRVHFERQSFWDARNCVYWADARHAALPPKCRARGARHLLRAEVRFLRLPRAELQPWLERWPLEGPQSWDQRRWSRIEGSREFGGTPSTRGLR
jgi:hypothetical protein